VGTNRPNIVGVEWHNSFSDFNVVPTSSRTPGSPHKDGCWRVSDKTFECCSEVMARLNLHHEQLVSVMVTPTATHVHSSHRCLGSMFSEACDGFPGLRANAN
jgi:hypothetical protein